MEEGEAAPVLIQTAAQIVPSIDLMHRLIFDQLFQHHGGRAPVDPLQRKEAPVEPGTQQMLQIAVDSLQFRIGAQVTDKKLAHCDNGGGAARREIQAPHQLLARGLDRSGQRLVVFRIRLLVIGGDGLFNLHLIGRHLLIQEIEEIELFLLRERVPGGHRIAGERHARRLALLGQQVPAQPLDTVVPFLVAPEIEQFPSGVGDGVKQLSDKCRRHISNLSHSYFFRRPLVGSGKEAQRN